uniref:Uncharacterized protein n=1 Tax=Chromera velia CCMP2878 TaxID=1169474 RepID=A0A0G4G8D3_9ALVE|eukprot:Cvel_20625.t1-p1 / transcript=Cvel_20625.t1 / gene=Cvel_20625 / organism=Chromera_velia_CCMP2878 / gene_product=hypothetical protein / transcript_product=hypothetical protein / location=Cvel_scaffold1869:578-1395(+) / protein_length=80 / sequence_SO=supercontig / SO=protein_coding / is_pseudo=false
MRDGHMPPGFSQQKRPASSAARLSVRWEVVFSIPVVRLLSHPQWWFEVSTLEQPPARAGSAGADGVEGGDGVEVPGVGCE